jgi:hypothetical protein
LLANGAVFVLAAVLLVVRRPSGVLTPVFWGEDGKVFFAQQYIDGFAPQEPYNGALYVGQRLAAWFLAAFPVTMAPAIYYLTACLLTVAALAVVLQRRAHDLFGGWWWRAAVLIVLVLIPGVEEIQGSIVNLHWWFAIALAVVLALPAPRTRWGRVAELAFIVIVGLSGFASAFLLPVAIWALVRHRSRYLWTRVIVVGSTAAVQVAVAIASPRKLAQGFPLEHTAMLGAAIVRRVGGVMVLGHDRVESSWPAHELNWLYLLAGGFIVGVVVIASFDWAGPSPWWLVGGLGFAASVALANASASLREVLGSASDGRYFAPLIGLIVLILWRALATAGAVALRILAAALLCACAVGWWTDFRLQERAPPGGAAELTAFAQCLREADRTCKLRQLPGPRWEVTIPVRPPGRG